MGDPRRYALHHIHLVCSDLAGSEEKGRSL